MELGVVLHALRRPTLQFVDEKRMRIRPFRVTRLRDFIVSQAILERAFAKLRQIRQCRQDDVRGDTMKLGRAAGDAIKFLNGQLERAIILRTAAEQRRESSDLENRFYRVVAVSVLARNNHGAAIMLQDGSESLAGRGASPASQNNEWPRVSDSRIGV